MIPVPPSYLRDRQKAAFVSVFEGLRIRRQGSMLVSVPTGVGKTMLSLAVSFEFRRVLFLVHRRELLTQTLSTYGRLGGVRGVDGGVVGGVERNEAHLVVMMVQTLARRLREFSPVEFDLVVCDEAHHAVARDWRVVLEYFLPELHLGLSATPERLDGRALSDLYPSLAYFMTVREAVSEGLLVSPTVIEVGSRVDLSRVKRSRGDFNAGALERAVNVRERNELVLRSFVEFADGRGRAVGFTAGVSHARDLAELFSDAGIPAVSVAGSDSDRVERLRALDSGAARVVFNSMLLTEGWDDPLVDTVLMCRPTQSKALYVQAVGRGLRLSEGKVDCLVIDFTDASRKHRLVNVWDFWGVRLASRVERPTNLLELEERIRAQVNPVTGSFEVVTELIDVLSPPPDVHPEVDAAFGMMRGPASDTQLRTLAELGFDVSVGWSRAEASELIGGSPPSLRQKQLLLALGYDVITVDWSRAQATAAIKLAQSRGVTPDWNQLRLFNLKPDGK
jgi:superfamily II DNA or RNA helicase